ncbi:glycoside hydrolase family 57 protein [Gracilinema caldarium]|uniref:glycoside hydrolase family 57 protein n=1 Tax=Gracilinema caldarium TaxID=215591 RepID=UPI0026EF250D|nr:1,4-alpha-glucan branching protein domain-containing protein [Gracilinema caldarium]
MNDRYSLSLVLHAHVPFVRQPEYPRFLEERWFFDALLETYLPLITMFEQLDAERIPFHIALVLSPTLSHMLQDPLLIERFLEYLDQRIVFGLSEVDRTRSQPDINRLARMYYDRVVEAKALFTGRYEHNILKALDFYQKKGKIEILTTAATHAFLPFYIAYPEDIQAQLEVAISSHRALFGRLPQGFWLPEAGWHPALDEVLRSYNFNYTIVDTHGLLLGNPTPQKGTFAPVRSPSGMVIYGRDLKASRAIWDPDVGYPADPVYRDFYRDIGYELDQDLLEAFLELNGERTPTGYKYWAITQRGQIKNLYNPDLAADRVRFHAQSFLADRLKQLQEAEQITGEKGISVCAYNADLFGHRWFEGPQFLEALFREAAEMETIAFVNPGVYTNKIEKEQLQKLMPEFSSWGLYGYAETWLDSSNDWMYPHILRAIERMIELAERFPNDGGLKERTLNQAAREVLLAQSADWAAIQHGGFSSTFARSMVEDCIQNFTTIYDSLGSNYISTEWLTQLERKHNIFPDINYRVFRKKR